MTAHRPRKRFAQHFLTDPGVVDEIVRSIRPSGNDIVVEIGPGLAAITAPLLADAGSMHAIELDRDLAAQLRQRFADEPKLTIHEADALRFDYSTLGEDLRVVGNYRTTFPRHYCFICSTIGRTSRTCISCCKKRS